MKLEITYFILLLILVSTMACSGDDRFYTPGSVSAEIDLIAEKARTTSSLELVVEREVVGSSSAEIMFLLDNSFSMSDDLAKLRDSLRLFRESIGNSNVDYRLRFLNLSMMKSFSGQRFGVEGNLGTILSGLTFEGPYPFGAQVFDRASSPATILADVISKSAIDSTLQYEMGIALASSFLAWNSWGNVNAAQKLKAGALHFVVLSNEDNYSGFNNVKGGNGNLLPLYSYTKGLYRGTATNLGFCQAKGWAISTVPSVPASRLFSDTHYVRNDLVSRIGQVNSASSLSVGSFYCRSSSVDGFWSLTNISNSSRVCRVAENLSCPTKIDGINVWAPTKNISSVQCIAEPGSSRLERVISQAYIPSSAVEVGSCESITCEGAAKMPAEVFTFGISNRVITDIRRVAIPNGYSEVTVRPAPRQLRDVCSGELEVALPSDVTVRAILSQSSTRNFEYAAAPGMSVAEVKSHVASLNQTTVDQVSISSFPNETSRAFAATPAGLLDLATYQRRDRGSFVWHSIVGRGDRCSDPRVGGEFSDGVQYKELSRLTGGAREDICSPNFDAFFQRLSESLRYGAKRSYALSTSIPIAGILEVKNTTRGISLQRGTDYFIEGDRLVFTAAAPIGPGDSLSIIF